MPPLSWEWGHVSLAAARLTKNVSIIRGERDIGGYCVLGFGYRLNAAVSAASLAGRLIGDMARRGSLENMGEIGDRLWKAVIRDR